MMSKGSDQVLEAMGPEILFFPTLFSVTDVNVLSWGSDLIRHSRMDFIVLCDSRLFMSYNDDEGPFIFSPYAKEQLCQKPLINNEQSIQFKQ